MKERGGKSQSIGIQSVEIGFRVLEIFGRSSAPMSLKQVSEASGMAPSKVHRYLVSFVRSGMLVQMGANGLYDLGPTARRLGMSAMGRLDSFAIASNHVAKLRDATGHTVCLTVWGDMGPVLVRWENGSQPLLATVRIGSSVPLAESAMGLLFLAHMPTAATAAVLKQQRQLAGTRVSKDPSPEYLNDLRTKPSLHLSSAMIAGIDSVAAPVFDAQDNLSSVITILAPSRSLQGPKAHVIIDMVAETAKQTSIELGCSRWTHA